MADISAPYNEIIRRRIEGAGVPQTKGGALAQGLGMVPQKAQGTTLEELQKNSLNNVFGFPEIGMKEIYQAGLGLGQKVTEGLGMFSGEGGRLPAPMLDAALSATKYLTSPSAAAEAIATEGITDNSIFEATDIPDIMFERKPGESRDDFKNRFLETDPKFEKGKTTITPGTSGRNKGTPARDGASDEARAQDMIIAKRKKQQEEQLLADKNREASLDMPSDPAEQLFSQAMSDYISQARTGAEDDLPEIGDIEDYKKKFAEATGVDISGKPDTSQALMAMGLSMMQNRAGKGFNVGKMLSAVGEAGEKALPALAKANAEARNNVIAAGKYALTAQDADEKTRKAAEKDLMERGQFYVFEKGPKGKPYLNFDNGDLSYLNKSELNKLMNNKGFNDKYSFISAKDYFDLQKESAAPKDLGKPYGKEKSVSLLGGDTEGVNPIYIVEAQLPDGNYKGNRKKFGHLQSNPESVVRNIVNEQQSILTEQKEFKSLIESVQSGVSIPEQIGSSIVQFGRNLGIDLGSGPTQIAQARKKLEKIQLLNATEILRESGKTLSDQDRERVKSFVGSIDLANADEALILQSIGRVYDIILGARQRNLDTAVSNLETNFGIKFNAGTEKSSAITKEELEEINKTRQQNGLKPRTMDDYQ